ncbi:hypothetical protein [Amycolatopsis thermoflava]|uniref:hypothetical protein n=1 Tax=Amycolatopsis thermoflava TaxID=84480 RepID=UPI003646424F
MDTTPGRPGPPRRRGRGFAERGRRRRPLRHAQHPGEVLVDVGGGVAGQAAVRHGPDAHVEAGGEQLGHDRGGAGAVGEGHNAYPKPGVSGRLREVVGDPP